MALGDLLITQSSGIVKSRYDDEILGAPEDLLITQASEIVKSCYGDEILRGPRGDLLITQAL